MKIVLAPDSFKGSLSAGEVCEIMKAGITALDPEATVLSMPIADGGEGTVDAVLAAAKGRAEYAEVHGPYGEKVRARYAMLPGNIAVIETASAAGLTMVGENRNAERTSTFGVGELMLDAVRKGARMLMLGLGGSATVDGGCGAAAALGVAFTEKGKKSFVPVGATLGAIDRIDTGTLAPEMLGVTLRVLSDVENPLFGPDGAAYVFGPQKGADQAMVLRLDAGLRHLAERIRTDVGFDVSNLPGAGAAGGMGAGMCAFLGGKIESGIDSILDMNGFEREIRDCDLIYTGEGRVDSQSLQGKAVSGIARRARALGKPVVVIAGGEQAAGTSIYEAGVTAVFAICRTPMTLREAISGARENLAATVGNVHRLVLAFRAGADGGSTGNAEIARGK